MKINDKLALIGAGSILLKDIPNDSMAYSVPAKIVGDQ